VGGGVNFWEFLDRRGERRARRGPMFRFDTKTLIGFGFLAGYYLLVYTFTRAGIPPANLDLVRDAMLTLGPPVGLIVGAMFRDSMRDEQATANTAAAFRAVEAAAAAGTGTGNGAAPDPKALQEGDRVELNRTEERQ
jgi:hypothetical protein